jgi:integrase
MGTILERKTSSGEVRYAAQVRLKGSKLQMATFNRKTDAKRWIQQTEAAIREGRHFRTAEAKRRTVAEMVDRYLQDVLPTKSAEAQRKQAAQLAWWRGAIGHLMLADATPRSLSAARDELARTPTSRGGQRSGATVVRYMAALSHVFTIAVREWEWLTVNPMQSVSRPKESRGRVRYLDEDERERLVAACRASKSQHLHSVVVLALSTGMRQGEILGLRWRDVDLERGRITLHETKNDERRVVPLVGPARDLLKARSKVRRLNSDLVFPAKARQGVEPKPAEIRHVWRRAVQRAEIDDFRFHDLRHTAASYLAMNGATLSEIAAVLGHKTLSMVKRYAHLSEAHTTGVVERMNQRFLGEV